MRALTCHITIGSLIVRHAAEVEVVSGWEELGDTCTIRLPRLAKLLAQQIKVGDAVTVKLGYDGANRTVFEGYVTEVSPNIPLEIRCEDEVYHLKRKQVAGGSGYAWRSASLQTILTYLMAAHGFAYQIGGSVPDVTLEPFRIERGTTVAQALQKLKEKYFFTAYFRGKTLYIGLPYSEFAAVNVPVDRAAGRFAIFDFQTNIVPGNSLVFRRADEMKLKATAISLLPDNKRLEEKVGADDGQERTLLYRNITSRDTLRQLALADLDKYRYDGYTGDFTAFGLPAVIHSATVELRDAEYPERAGRYLADQVTTTWGTGGFLQRIKLGKKNG